MVWTYFLVLASLAASVCFAQRRSAEPFLTEVTKGNPEYIDQVVEIGKYAIKHGDCLAELDAREVHCPDENALGAVKVRVEEQGSDAEVVIPDVVVGTIFGGKVAQKRWRIAIARRGEVCRSPLPQTPAKVTLYAACYPLSHGTAQVVQTVDNDAILL